MIVEETFFNIKCDKCGALVDEESWQGCVDFCEDSAQGWIKTDDGRYFCDNCFEIDDDDNAIVGGEKIDFMNYYIL